jgi:hypothetical protein
MADALETLRRMQRQAARRGGPVPAQRPTEPPRANPPGAADVGAEEETTPVTAGPVMVRGPLDATTPLTPAARQALEAAGLIVDLEDGRCVVLGLPAGTVLAWPLGVVDAEGRPLPYLRNAGPVVPFAAADGWKWWRGGLTLGEVLAQLVAAQKDEETEGGRR